MVTEYYVNFEIAKLLKEKGFGKRLNEFCPYSYSTFFGETDLRKGMEHQTYAPTIQRAMKWLREVHDFHIMVDCLGAENYMPTIQFTRSSKDIEIESGKSKFGGNGFDSYEEAVVAAMRYCLENLVRDEKDKVMSVVNDMCTMSMDQPFLFDCAVRFNNADEKETVTFCMCDHEQHADISASPLDSRIFYYVMSPEEFEGVLDGGEDFTVMHAYASSYETVHLDSL